MIIYFLLILVYDLSERLCPFIFKHRVGLDIPTIEVRFEHLNVEAGVYVGRRALPTMLNFSLNMLEVIKLDSQIDVKHYQTLAWSSNLISFSAGYLKLSSHHSKYEETPLNSTGCQWNYQA